MQWTEQGAVAFRRGDPVMSINFECMGMKLDRPGLAQEATKLETTAFWPCRQARHLRKEGRKSRNWQEANPQIPYVRIGNIIDREETISGAVTGSGMYPTQWQLTRVHVD